MSKRSLTYEERQQLRPVLERVDAAMEELSAELRRLGRPTGEEAEGSNRCLVPECTCQHFKSRGAPNPLQCKTPQCGHSYTQHDFA